MKKLGNEHVLVQRCALGGPDRDFAARVAAGHHMLKCLVSKYREHRVGPLDEHLVDVGWRLRECSVEDLLCGARVGERLPDVRRAYVAIQDVREQVEELKGEPDANRMR
jgi:hypothetical protein